MKIESERSILEGDPPKGMVLIVDPPEGHRHGFPRECPKGYNDWAWEQKGDWMVEQGYPRKKIEAYGDYFHCRYWEMEKHD
jgi:hypothetical protein